MGIDTGLQLLHLMAQIAARNPKVTYIALQQLELETQDAAKHWMAIDIGLQLLHLGAQAA